MNISEYLSYFLIITAAGALYSKYKEKTDLQCKLQNNNLIQNFLLNNNELGTNTKPILWIHTSHYTNARYWPSFFSRNTTEINQPYIILCIENIINQCSNDFNVVLIDDKSFTKLIPGWSIEVENLPDPIRCHTRQLAIMKLLYYYGGLICPNSFVPLKSLKNLYEQNIKVHDCFVGEFVDRNSTSALVNFFPNPRLVGCKKNSSSLRKIVQYLELLNSKDYTNESDFLGQLSRYLYKLCNENEMTSVDGSLLGIKDTDNNPILINDLLGNSYLKLNDKCVGIYIPADEILKRTHYQWFARLSREQILEGNMIISKYFILSLQNNS
uniref:Uncharacterized protein n=1 Tax=viral metagenome TaxID=1070528 RepID=A0A6C0KGM8_9ZZZZ